MRARAPGKIVLSGAYAVLTGAPAIVTAVDRYVIADAARRADRGTPEVSAAIGSDPAPYFDASELRQGEHKLGLGSSAAILVASLAARALALGGDLADADLARVVFDAALAAHARAQGGGSGVDVAASTFGGTLVYRRGTPPALKPIDLPSDLVIEAWWSKRPAVTAELVGRVSVLAGRDGALHERLIGDQVEASSAAERALGRGSVSELVAALSAQRAALHSLGRAAGADIVTAEVELLAAMAERAGATVLPAGAGGGDIVLHAGRSPSSSDFRALAAEHAHVLLPLALGARGVHAFAPPARGASLESGDLGRTDRDRRE
jgi:phosphomevalonate kinase